MAELHEFICWLIEIQRNVCNHIDEACLLGLCGRLLVFDLHVFLLNFGRKWIRYDVLLLLLAALGEVLALASQLIFLESMVLVETEIVGFLFSVSFDLGGLWEVVGDVV